MAMTIGLQGEPLSLDARYLYDPMLSPYFRAQDTSGGSQYTIGGGNGYGWLDYSKIPGLERFAQQPSAGVSGGGDENIAAQLAAQGYRLYEEPITSGSFNSGQMKRGIVDAQGNFVGAPQLIDMPRDEGFWYGGLLAGATAGAAAGGAFSGAPEAGASSGGATSFVDPSSPAYGFGAEPTLQTGFEGLYADPAIAGEAAGGFGVGPYDFGQTSLTGTGPSFGDVASGVNAASNVADGTKTTPETTTPGKSFMDDPLAWLKANPEIGKLLFAGLGAGLTQAGGSTGNTGGYQDSGYRPTISRGGWQPSVQPEARSLLTPQVNLPTGKGLPYAGLWRYQDGLLGG